MLKMICNVCTWGFRESTDHVIVCKHHKGPVHLGCCRDRCLKNGKPCRHSIGMYKRVEKFIPSY